MCAYAMACVWRLEDSLSCCLRQYLFLTAVEVSAVACEILELSSILSSLREHQGSLCGICVGSRDQVLGLVQQVPYPRSRILCSHTLLIRC